MNDVVLDQYTAEELHTIARGLLSERAEAQRMIRAQQTFIWDHEEKLRAIDRHLARIEGGKERAA